MTSDQTWDLFLAHAGPDGPLAKQLFDLLDSKLRVFLDLERIELGDDWDDSLAAAQQRSLVTVVLVSSRTERAYYQREEIAAAIAMARADAESHRVVPIYLVTPGEDIYIPYGLRLKHSLTLSETLTLSDAAARLIDLVTKTPHDRHLTQSSGNLDECDKSCPIGRRSGLERDAERSRQRSRRSGAT